MTDPLSRLTTALADRYAIERELGAGGILVSQTPRSTGDSRRASCNLAGLIDRLRE